MRSHVRFSLLALITGAIIAVMAPAAAQAAFGVENFFASNCKVNTCKRVVGESPAEEKAHAEAEGFTQAAGHPNFGITDFKINTTGTFPNEVPSGIVTHVRTDVAPGVSTNPEAVPKCSFAEFGGEALPKTGLYLETACKAETEIGINQAVVFAGAAGDVPLEGKVYNLVQPKGLASDFGVALKLPKALTEAELFEVFKGSQPAIEKAQYFAHTLIEGNVEWGAQARGTGKADYHDYFEINVSPSLPLISSRLIFKGNIGTGGFLTNATSCNGVGAPQTTSGLTLTPKEGSPAKATYTTPIAIANCFLVPFEPGFSLTPETTQSDQPDGITTELSLPHDPDHEALDTSQLKTASVTLPEGMTMNPSAAAGLAACTPAQARITSEEEGVACPEASKIGTVKLEVPGLPAGSLQGNIYLGGPESGPITGPPYTIYLDAESSQYGISVRLKGSATPDETTGRVTTTFSENPEQPFSNAILHFNGGALAPIANPLTCGTATTETTLTPYSSGVAKSPFSQFVVDSNNAKGACASPIPFNWTQSESTAPAKAGASPVLTFNLARADGQQYLEQAKVTLPPGLVGKIPAVAQCTEALATAGNCPANSKIGTVVATAGSGSSPYPFPGNVYLTGPYKGAPYGLAFEVPVVSGPFNLGTEITRSKIEIDEHTARVIVTTPEIPTIRGGIPVRLRSLAVTVDAPNYILNPTNCSAFKTESVLTSTFGATQNVSSPFQVEGCSSLGFKPSFKATTGGKPTKANGASIETTINQPAGQANIKSVLVQLPKQLPSRLTTLNKACPEKTFASNPYHCPSGSFVGGVRLNTPVLPSKMTGPAILVSHGGEAFPDLDLVTEANGVRVIVAGNTKITKGITTSNFAATPDVPVSSVTVNLPMGAHSLLAANGNLCTSSLVMPTTITGQNGKQIKQNTKIAVSNCPVRIAGKKVVGNTAFLTIQTYSAGRISGSGGNLATVYRHLKQAQKTASLQVPLSSGGKSKGRPLSARVRVGFFPKKKGAPTSVAYTTVIFR